MEQYEVRRFVWIECGLVDAYILDTQTSENNIEAQWQEEITNRVHAIESGNAVGINFEDSIINIRNRLSQ